MRQACVISPEVDADTQSEGLYLNDERDPL